MAINKTSAPRTALRRVDLRRLARECAKLDPDEERALAEEIFAAEILDESDEIIGDWVGNIDADL